MFNLEDKLNFTLTVSDYKVFHSMKESIRVAVVDVMINRMRLIAS